MSPWIIITKLAILLLIDVLFVGLLALLLAPLVSYRRAAFAVLKRNFVGYFSNPTGYVFLFVFVALTSACAFWPDAFFNANLANLDQLNKVLPVVMLIFIPAITMSIWADERRQGTDELLLTIPATDFDIVVGKYLAAASIFTASLLFSQLSNFMVLLSLSLGEVDIGLYFATYLGYWLIGLAMLSIGMVASFLTSNLTVSFILGAVLNIPLVFASRADVIFAKTDLADLLARWSYDAQFDNFGRGVVSLASLMYFFMIVVVGLYFCMVLVGRRHWQVGGAGFTAALLQMLFMAGAVTSFLWVLALPPRGAWFFTALGLFIACLGAAVGVLYYVRSSEGGKHRDAEYMLGHYSVRSLCLILAVLGVSVVLTNHDVIRVDATAGRTASLSPDTISLVGDLDTKYPVVIDAYISRDLPEAFVKSKLALVSLLKEFEARSNKVVVHLHENLEPFSNEAAEAQQQFGIKTETVRTRTRGAYRDEEVLLGVALTCGLQRVVIPFFDFGTPVEYELSRAILAVTTDQRLKLGVVRTDAQLNGGLQQGNMMMMQQPRSIPKQTLIEELERIYNVEEVVPDSTIDPEKYDVLLVAQPSSLSPRQLENVLAALRAGVPAAIFEDPFPYFLGWIPGTGAPKQPNQMMGGGMPEPKCDITKLWKLLGIEKMTGNPTEGPFGGFDAHVIWQQYNPYPVVRGVMQRMPEFVFASANAPGAKEPFNADVAATAGLREVLFVAPGAIEQLGGSKLKFTPLVTTSDQSGYVKTIDFSAALSDQQGRKQPKRIAGAKDHRYVLAAQIQGDLTDGDAAPEKKPEAEKKKEDEKKKNDKKGKDKNAAKDDEDSKAVRAHKKNQVNVIYVADLDVLASVFWNLRKQPPEEANIVFNMENIPFVLNVVDQVASRNELLEIRKRRTNFASLRMIDESTRTAREQATEQEQNYEEKMQKAEEKAKQQQIDATKELQAKIEDLNKRKEKGEQVSGELLPAVQLLEIKMKEASDRYNQEHERLEREKERQKKEIERNLDLNVLGIQNLYKKLAVIIPPLPPLIIGLVVFVRRRLREREGMSRARLR